MQELKSLCSEIAACRRCDLYFSRKNAVCGSGSDSPKIMIVGEAPGAKEDLMGKPFVGRSGQLLHRALSSAGIQQEDIYITNSVRCRPKIGKSPRTAEIRMCSDYLKREIDHLKPRVMVPMGNSAIKSLSIIFGIDLGKISEVEGTFIYISGLILAPQYNPAAILRNPKKLERFKDNFKKVAALFKDISLASAEEIAKAYEIRTL